MEAQAVRAWTVPSVVVALQDETTATPRDLERLQYRVLAVVTESLDQVYLPLMEL